MLKKWMLLSVVVCLVAFYSLPVLAQEPAAMGPPKVLRIFRDEVKPGKGAAHEKNETAWAKAFVTGKYPAHFLAATSISGPSEAWFFEGHDSLASVERTEQFVEKNAALRAEFQRFAAQDGDLLNRTSTIVANFREDLSYRPTGVNLGQMRYFYVTTWRVRPGHNNDFYEATKMIRDAHEKANVPEHWAVFEVTLGMARGTFLTIQPMKSLSEVDDFPKTHGKAFSDALGEEGQKKLGELIRSGILTAETDILAFSPSMSYVSKETAAADPAFWNPKPKPAAKPAAEGTGIKKEEQKGPTGGEQGGPKKK